jgi:hypothetical protein
MTIKQGMQKILKEILHAEEKDKCVNESTGKNKSHYMSR